MAKRHTVLIVDDDPDVLLSLELFLERDYHVLAARGGAEALELLKLHQVAVIIADQRMPGMTGVEMLEHSIAISPDSMRIMLTGFADLESIIKAINEGRIYRYISKPWEPVDLEIDVKHAVETYDMRRLKQEVDVATWIQQHLFQDSWPQVSGYEIAAASRPSHEVGGDYFDISQDDAGRIWAALGDVTDKGVPAALNMATFRALYHSALGTTDDLSTAVHYISDGLAKCTPTQVYATMSCGILDPEQNTYRYINAGHPYPLLVKSDGKRETGHVSGMPVGFDPMFSADAVYEEHQMALTSGDLLVIYSDGVTEAPNAQDPDDLFDEDRLFDVMTAQVTQSAETAMEAIFDEVTAFQGGGIQSDDVTLIVIKVK